MPNLPDVIEEDAIDVIGIVAQRTTGTGLADRADTPLVVLQCRVFHCSVGVQCGIKGEASTSWGIFELCNLTILSLEANLQGMPSDNIANGIACAKDVFGIAL